MFRHSEVFRTNVGNFEGMLIKASVARDIGLPDPRFFITWDDAIYGWLAAQQTPVVYVNAFVIKKVRAQRQVDLGLRHLNDSSDLSRRYVMRNRGHVAQYLQGPRQVQPGRFRGRDGPDLLEGNRPAGPRRTDPEGDRRTLAGMAGIARHPGRHAAGNPCPRCRIDAWPGRRPRLLKLKRLVSF